MIFIPTITKWKTAYLFTHSEWKGFCGVKKGQNCNQIIS